MRGLGASQAECTVQVLVRGVRDQDFEFPSDLLFGVFGYVTSGFKRGLGLGCGRLASKVLGDV